jgi:hypothetical protein
MWMNQLLARFLSRTAPRRGAPRPRPRFQPMVMPLEDRMVPASFTAASVQDLIADINAANLTVEADSITLVAGKSFSLNAVNNTTDGATGLPVIAAGEDLTIFGNGDTIARSTTKGTPAFRLLDVAAGATLTLENMTLKGGLANGGGAVYDPSVYSQTAAGGAIDNQGTLTLTGVTVTGNTARGNDGEPAPIYPTPGSVGLGGGIYSSGALTMTGCSIGNNQAIGGKGSDEIDVPGGAPGESGGFPGQPGGNAAGGGLYVAGGTVTINNCTFNQNTAQGGVGGSGKQLGVGGGGTGLGGGICVAGGTVTVHTTSIAANIAQGGVDGNHQMHSRGAGGGIYLSASASAGLDAYTVSHTQKNKASTSDDNIAGFYVVVL